MRQPMLVRGCRALPGRGTECTIARSSAACDFCARPEPRRSVRSARHLAAA